MKVKITNCYNFQCTDLQVNLLLSFMISWFKAITALLSGGSSIFETHEALNLILS